MVKKSFRRLSTTELQKLLRDDCDGRGALTVEQTLAVCEILAQRDGKDPQAVRDAWAKFLKYYMDDPTG